MTDSNFKPPTSNLQPRPAVAVGLIADRDGQLLLQHRDDKPGLPGAGLWGMFGGHVEPGEAPDDAFLREMDEELGWRPRHFEPLAAEDIVYGGSHVTSHVFAAHLDVPETALTLNEGQGLALYSPAALPADMLPGTADLIARFTASRTYGRVRRPWRSMTSAGLLVDRDGRFLLQHRDDKPGIANPGLWGSFGGEIEPYETPQRGFLRELQEELSWQPRMFELHAAVPFGPARDQLIYIFAAPVDVPQDRLVLGEGQGLAFFAPDALPEATVPELRTLIESYAATDAFGRIRGAAH